MSKKVIRLPLTGHCQCGQVSYKITAMPLTLYACHCSECQRQSSSAYGMSMPVPRSGYEVSGELRYWDRVSDSGTTVQCAFCPSCGTRMFHLPSRNKDIINVKPGTLDDTSWVEPVGHLWISSAQGGTRIPEHRLQYSHQPKTFEPLFQAWQAEFEGEGS
jgi:hypothetical protein